MAPSGSDTPHSNERWPPNRTCISSAEIVSGSVSRNQRIKALPLSGSTPSISSQLTASAGAPPQAPGHSMCSTVNVPFSDISPSSVPDSSSIAARTSSAPRSQHEIEVHTDTR